MGEAKREETVGCEYGPGELDMIRHLALPGQGNF